MAVGVEGEGDCAVAEEFLNHLGVHAAAKRCVAAVCRRS